MTKLKSEEKVTIVSCVTKFNVYSPGVVFFFFTDTHTAVTTVVMAIMNSSATRGTMTPMYNVVFVFLENYQ